MKPSEKKKQPQPKKSPDSSIQQEPIEPPLKDVNADAITLRRGDFERHAAQALDYATGMSQTPIRASDVLVGIASAERAGEAIPGLMKMLEKLPSRVRVWPDTKPEEQTQFEFSPGMAVAIDIARRAVLNRNRIWGRALVTAMLFGPERLDPAFEDPPPAEWRQSIQREWRNFLQIIDLEHFDSWENAIAQLEAIDEETIARTGGTRYRLTRYTPDTASGRDLLRITRDVEAMASVIAARSVEPPLSIGLFGNWGSGKTFFMEKLDQAILRRTQAMKSANAADTLNAPYVERIASIWFNAWHYMDASLWPSLVMRIFEGLAENTRNTNEEVDEARTLLLKEADLARNELDAAEQEYRIKSEALAAQRKEAEVLGKSRESLEAELQRLDLWEILKESSVATELLREFGHAIDLDADQVHEAFGEIGAVLAEMKRIGPRLKRLAKGNFPSASLRTGLGVWLLITGGAAIGAYFLVRHFIEDLQPLLGAIGTTVAASLSWLTAKLKKAADFAHVVREKRAEVLAAAKSESDRRSEAGQNRLRHLAEEEQAARQRVLGLQEAELDAREKVRDATAGRMLERFIQDRIDCDEYQRNLGVISLIRQDLEKLSALFRRSRSSETREERFAIDRIVLFIDDLDRCPRNRVVEVLQAVYLLLALDLFVVVVAVDPRWLCDALGEAENLELHVDTPSNGDSDQATPINYLEKIFQIPYSLGEMLPGNYAEYVMNMTESANTGVSISERGIEVSALSARPQVTKANTGGATVEPEHTGADPTGDSEMTPDVLASLLRPEPVVLTTEERQFLAKLGPPVIRTPRGAKRLVNCYRFLRATVAAEELDAFMAPTHPRFAAASTLLAISIGDPAVASKLFDILISGGADDVNKAAGDFIAMSVQDQEKQVAISDWLEALSGELDRLTVEDLLVVLPLVRKFSLLVDTE